MKAKKRLPIQVIEKLDHYQHIDEFGKWLGYQISVFHRKKLSAEVRLKIRKSHLSSSGRVHGGAISALFDYACGAAVFLTLGKRDFSSTVELKVHYFRPLNLGDELVAKTQVVFRGKRLCVAHGFLYRLGEKAPVAMASATFNVVTAI